MNGWLGYDIEIAKVLPEGETDWQRHKPLGISCAALVGDGIEMRWWGVPQMSREQCDDMLALLWLYQERIVGFNTLSFDLQVLAEETGRWGECRILARNHCDPMFQFYVQRGFPVGLNAMAQGMGVGGKTEGMSGALAPQMWADGEHAKVLEYVTQDARLTYQLATAIQEAKGISWVTKKGLVRSESFPNGLLTVSECLQLPDPDQSWMDNPIPRSQFAGWLEAEPVAA